MAALLVLIFLRCAHKRIAPPSEFRKSGAKVLVIILIGKLLIVAIFLREIYDNLRQYYRLIYLKI